MTSENEDLQNCKTAAQAALSRILTYLEPICRTLQEEEGLEPNPVESVYLPQKAMCLLHDTGHLEGLRLKALGALSGDILNLIQELGLCFEVEVRFDASFKLPYVGSIFQLECKSMNPWRVEAWRLFHGGLLSAYALQPLHLQGQGLPNPLEATLVVCEGDEPKLHKPAEIPREAIHAANNLLTGILNYSSLILKSPPTDGGLTEKVGLIQEAARKLALKILPNPPGTPEIS
jgi:hypothetical protein